MKLNELLPLLEDEINNKMTEFAKRGKRAKKLREETDVLYQEMKDIALELKYVLPIVKEQNPEMIELLDELTK